MRVPSAGDAAPHRPPTPSASNRHRRRGRPGGTLPLIAAAQCNYRPPELLPSGRDSTGPAPGRRARRLPALSRCAPANPTGPGRCTEPALHPGAPGAPGAVPGGKQCRRTSVPAQGDPAGAERWHMARRAARPPRPRPRQPSQPTGAPGPLPSQPRRLPRCQAKAAPAAQPAPSPGHRRARRRHTSAQGMSTSGGPEPHRWRDGSVPVSKPRQHRPCPLAAAWLHRAGPSSGAPARRTTHPGRRGPRHEGAGGAGEPPARSGSGEAAARAPAGSSEGEQTTRSCRLVS